MAKSADAKLRVDADGELVSILDEDGREVLDPTPMAPPVGFVPRDPLHERIRALVKHEHERVLREKYVESPEEADDFRIPAEEGDDPREGRFALLPGYEWEENYEPPKDFKEMRDRLVEAGWKPPEEGAAAEPQRTPPEGGAAAVVPQVPEQPVKAAPETPQRPRQRS